MKKVELNHREKANWTHIASFHDDYMECCDYVLRDLNDKINWMFASSFDIHNIFQPNYFAIYMDNKSLKKIKDEEEKNTILIMLDDSIKKFKSNYMVTEKGNKFLENLIKYFEDILVLNTRKEYPPHDKYCFLTNCSKEDEFVINSIKSILGLDIIICKTATDYLGRVCKGAVSIYVSREDLYMFKELHINILDIIIDFKKLYEKSFNNPKTFDEFHIIRKNVSEYMVKINEYKLQNAKRKKLLHFILNNESNNKLIDIFKKLKEGNFKISCEYIRCQYLVFCNKKECHKNFDIDFNLNGYRIYLLFKDKNIFFDFKSNNKDDNYIRIKHFVKNKIEIDYLGVIEEVEIKEDFVEVENLICNILKKFIQENHEVLTNQMYEYLKNCCK